ncbi:MAG: FkbM family methyltransferase [Hyphomicrobiales bacterium]
MIARPGETGVTGNIYYGLAEHQDMTFLLNELRPGDLFVDIGANAGAYAILASGVAGAASIAFEPVDETADRLAMNVRINDLADKVEIHRCALGAEKGQIRFTRDYDTTNRVAKEGEDAIVVEVDTLDNRIGSRQPAMLKIDVEGHEKEVLAGAQETLACKSLRAIIIETAEPDAISATLLPFGFSKWARSPNNVTFIRRLV